MRLRTARLRELGHRWEKTRGIVLPIGFASGALRLAPSLRVRLHGRSRLPDLALAMSLATTALFLGISFLAGPNPQEGSGGVESDSMVEMRSAATNETAVPVRHAVRLIRLDRTSIVNGAHD